jgi:hypothetical protein
LDKWPFTSLKFNQRTKPNMYTRNYMRHS